MSTADRDKEKTARVALWNHPGRSGPISKRACVTQTGRTSPLRSLRACGRLGTAAGRRTARPSDSARGSLAGTSASLKRTNPGRHARGRWLRQQPSRTRAIGTLHDVLPPPARGRHPGLGALWSMTQRCRSSVSFLGCTKAPIPSRAHGGAPPSNHSGAAEDPDATPASTITRARGESSLARARGDRFLLFLGGIASIAVPFPALRRAARCG
jgi:hypothetical protein